MKICIVGAGAIGGYLGVELARAGEDVTLVMRGANLAVVRQQGLALVYADGREVVARDLHVTDRMSEAGRQDVVILGMKAHQVAAVVPDLPALLGPDTPIVTTQNGIPWWYFMKHGGEYDGRRLESVDPGGAIAAGIDADRVIGSIAYPACEMRQPGVIRHIEGNRFTLGELDGQATERARHLSETLRRAGFKAPVASDIRDEIWLKLWGNLSFNPISALTHATLEDICRFPETRALAATMMEEARTVAEKLGVRFKVSLEKRIAGAEAVGPHKTSMLQDIEGGRPIELEALVGSVLELGRITATPTPAIAAVYACVSLLARTAAGGKVRVEPRSP
jgi:2-dehydropantoate 2-reductase